MMSSLESCDHCKHCMLKCKRHYFLLLAGSYPVCSINATCMGTPLSPSLSLSLPLSLQMDAKNLALCFSPSLFSLSSSPSKQTPSNPFPRIPSIKRGHTLNHTSSASPLTLSSTKEVTETVVCSI